MSDHNNTHSFNNNACWWSFVCFRQLCCLLDNKKVFVWLTRIFHGRHKFFYDGRQLLHQLCNYGGAVGHRSTIGSVCGYEVSNCINGFDMFLCPGVRQRRCNMKTCQRVGVYLNLPVLLKDMGAVQFELQPCFYGEGRSFQIRQYLAKIPEWKTI